MNSKTLYQYIKLGMNMEYLRGVSSVSIMPAHGLMAFPRLVENLPPNRYSVPSMIEVLKALFLQLEELGLEKTLAEAAQLRPLLEQMESYLSEDAKSPAAFMNDTFADKLVFFVKELLIVLKKEASGKLLGTVEDMGP